MGNSTHIGNSFFNSDMIANNVLQILSPSANTKGVYLRTLSMSSGGGTTSLYADTTAPTVVRDNTKRVILVSYFPNTSAYPLGGWTNLPNPLFIPAGMGLWVGSTAGASINLTYDLIG